MKRPRKFFDDVDLIQSVNRIDLNKCVRVWEFSQSMFVRVHTLTKFVTQQKNKTYIISKGRQFREGVEREKKGENMYYLPFCVYM